MTRSIGQLQGASRRQMARLLSACVDNAALANPSPVAEIRESTQGVLNTFDFPICRFAFGGTDADDESFQYQISGYQEYARGGTVYCNIPRILAKGVATLGTKAMGEAGADIESATALFADTITETLGMAGTLVFSEANNGIAWLEVDCSNCKWLRVEINRNNSAATASVIYQLGDRASGLMDVDNSIAGTGLALASHQVTANTAMGSVADVAAEGDAASGSIIARLRGIAKAVYTFVTAGGGGYIRQDSTGTIAKESSGNLEGVKTAIGTTADEPLGDLTTNESATARTGISLWKRMVNLLIGCYGKLNGFTCNTGAVVISSGSVTEASAASILSAVSSGLPVYGADATGADAYASVVVAPARVCHYLHVAVGDNGAIISCDAGSTDHFAIPANTERLFQGLTITSGVAIHGKNLSAGNNYTNLHISVW